MDNFIERMATWILLTLRANIKGGNITLGKEFTWGLIDELEDLEVPLVEGAATFDAGERQINIIKAGGSNTINLSVGDSGTLELTIEDIVNLSLELHNISQLMELLKYSDAKSFKWMQTETQKFRDHLSYIINHLVIRGNEIGLECTTNDNVFIINDGHSLTTVTLQEGNSISLELTDVVKLTVNGKVASWPVRQPEETAIARNIILDTLLEYIPSDIVVSTVVTESIGHVVNEPRKDNIEDTPEASDYDVVKGSPAQPAQPARSVREAFAAWKSDIEASQQEPLNYPISQLYGFAVYLCDLWGNITDFEPELTHNIEIDASSDAATLSKIDGIDIGLAKINGDVDVFIEMDATSFELVTRDAELAFDASVDASEFVNAVVGALLNYNITFEGDDKYTFEVKNVEIPTEDGEEDLQTVDEEPEAVDVESPDDKPSSEVEVIDLNMEIIISAFAESLVNQDTDMHYPARMTSKLPHQDAFVQFKPKKVIMFVQQGPGLVALSIPGYPTVPVDTTAGIDAVKMAISDMIPKVVEDVKVVDATEVEETTTEAPKTTKEAIEEVISVMNSNEYNHVHIPEGTNITLMPFGTRSVVVSSDTTFDIVRNEVHVFDTAEVDIDAINLKVVEVIDNKPGSVTLALDSFDTEGIQLDSGIYTDGIITESGPQMLHASIQMSRHIYSGMVLGFKTGWIHIGDFIELDGKRFISKGSGSVARIDFTTEATAKYIYEHIKGIAINGSVIYVSTNRLTKYLTVT